jgi:hypothetical protein
MVLGVSYEEAAAKLATDPAIFDTSGSGYHVLESQLVHHGYAVSRKWRVFQPGNQQRDQWPCEPFADLHWCEVISGGRGHAVLMLGDGTVLDPMSDEPKRLSDYEEVNFVAAVIPISQAAYAVSGCDGLRKRVSELEDLLAEYGDRVRMARAEPAAKQQVIDDAIGNALARATLSRGE